MVEFLYWIIKELFREVAVHCGISLPQSDEEWNSTFRLSNILCSIILSITQTQQVPTEETLQLAATVKFLCKHCGCKCCYFSTFRCTVGGSRSLWWSWFCRSRPFCTGGCLSCDGLGFDVCRCRCRCCGCSSCWWLLDLFM